MKIAYISDLHVDFGKHPKFTYPQDHEYDIIVICGDISNSAEHSAFFIEKIKSEQNKPVIFVSGNHDRWGLTIDESSLILNNQSFLNREIMTFNGYRFLGCTLWYNISSRDRGSDWSDFRYIKSWKDIANEYKLDQEFLHDNMKEGDIIITHMLPHFECIDSQYIGSVYNRFFMINMDSLIKERKPLAWFMGHSHSFLHRKIDETWFLRNPLGYFHESPLLSEWTKFPGICIFNTETGEVTNQVSNNL